MNKSILPKSLIEKHNLPEDKQEYFLLEWNVEKGIMDLDEMFGNTNPVTIEIGCGRGELIEKLSITNPQHNYLGIELSPKRIVTILKKLKPEKNSNVRLIIAEVNAQFLNTVPLNAIEQVIILHPDPWPKRKHHKYRLINSPFIKKLADILSDNGEVLISTDYEQYALEIMKQFLLSEDFESLYDEGHSRESFWNEIQTHFEVKKKKEGFHPYYMRYKKVCKDSRIS